MSVGGRGGVSQNPREANLPPPPLVDHQAKAWGGGMTKSAAPLCRAPPSLCGGGCPPGGLWPVGLCPPPLRGARRAMCHVAAAPSMGPPPSWGGPVQRSSHGGAAPQAPPNAGPSDALNMGRSSTAIGELRIRRRRCPPGGPGVGRRRHRPHPPTPFGHRGRAAPRLTVRATGAGRRSECARRRGSGMDEARA